MRTERTEAQILREERARTYVNLLKSQGIEDAGESVGTWFNLARFIFGDTGADNHLKETLEKEQAELAAVD